MEVHEIKERKTSKFTSFVFKDLLPLVLFWEQAFNLLALAFMSSKNRINKFTNKLIINTFIGNLTS